jgi:hypothetical protein
MKISVSDLLRVIAMLSGIVLLFVGIDMIRDGLSAEGTIDIKSSLFSGSLKTGSSGLFVCFFGFMIVGLALLSTVARTEKSGEGPSASTMRVKFALTVFFGLLASAIGCALLATSVTGDLQGLFGLLALGFGVITLFWIMPLSDAIDSIKDQKKG